MASTALRGGLGNAPRTLDKVAVLGNERLTAHAVAATTGLSKGADVSDVEIALLEQRVAAHPWIRSARVALLPTGTLIVEIDEREPRALLVPGAPGTTDDAFFVDAEGRAFVPVPVDAGATLPALVRAEQSPAAPEADLLARAVALADTLWASELPGLGVAGAPHRGLALALPAPDSAEGWVLHARRETSHATEGDAPGDLQVLLGREPLGDRLERLETLRNSDMPELAQASTIDMRFAEQAVLRDFRASR